MIDVRQPIARSRDHAPAEETSPGIYSDGNHAWTLSVLPANGKFRVSLARNLHGETHSNEKSRTRGRESSVSPVRT
jgi:hypothetical protein